MPSDPSTRIVNEHAAWGSPTEPQGRSTAASINLADLGRLIGTESLESPALGNVRFAVRLCKSGQSLARTGDPFRSLYAVRRGAFKLVGVSAGGAEQVLAFPMAGDVIGAEGIDAGVHRADVTALNDAEVAILPFAQLERLVQELPRAAHLLSRICGKALNGTIENMWMLGILSATARVALFLVKLSARLTRESAPRIAFDLPMTRAEIGSFLGISVETVSRVLGSLADATLITVRHRKIVIRNLAGLKAVAECDRAAPPSRRRSCTGNGSEDGNLVG